MSPVLDPTKVACSTDCILIIYKIAKVRQELTPQSRIKSKFDEEYYHDDNFVHNLKPLIINNGSNASPIVTGLRDDPAYADSPISSALLNRKYANRKRQEEHDNEPKPVVVKECDDGIVNSPASTAMLKRKYERQRLAAQSKLSNMSLNDEHPIDDDMDEMKTSLDNDDESI